jgi:3-dehydroquinate synthase
MLEELQPNSFEDRTLQRLVDFGHTFSATLEERSGYRLRHGEAVAIDMALSCEIAMRLEFLDARECDMILECFRMLGLPVSSTLMTLEAASHAMDVTEAHRGGSLNLVVPPTIGEGMFIADASDVPRGLLQASIDHLLSVGSERPFRMKAVRDDR